ncbi:MAG TPA: 4a-hydroxytetrahydrobiopterin dehydratase [Nitrospirota bacterium]|nr:4a-hydroxytetrahydrobiopterin dehydratase [Nitrospirota bacterium]
MKLPEQNTKSVTVAATPLSLKELEALLQQTPAWSLGEKEIVRDFRFKDFRDAMRFVNDVAAIANEQDHHPDIFISYNKVRVTLSTHKIGGLSLNDFVVAAKIDELADLQRPGKAA